MDSRHAAYARATRAATVLFLSIVFAAAAFGAPAFAEVSAADAKVGIIECTQAVLADHNPGLADNPDRLVCFTGYVSNFNVTPRKIGKKDRYLGVPHWVVHRIKRSPDLTESGNRPKWFTVPELAAQGMAPTHESYEFSKPFLKTHKNWYDRGHLAQKYLVERLGEKPAYFTHNVVNAVPQRHAFNAGPWLWLECMTGAWANKYGEVWVIAGPVFKKGRPITWLKSDSNKKALPVAIPVGVFKIVLRKDGGQWDVLSFVYPQTHKTYAKSPYDPEIWFKSVADIEQMTGERFLSGLPNADAIKEKMPEKLWPVAKSDYDQRGCKPQMTDVQ